MKMFLFGIGSTFGCLSILFASLDGQRQIVSMFENTAQTNTWSGVAMLYGIYARIIQALRAMHIF